MRLAILLLCSGCTFGDLNDFALTGDQLVIAFEGRFYRCDISGLGHLGPSTYELNERCEDLGIETQWPWLAAHGDAVLLPGPAAPLDSSICVSRGCTTLDQLNPMSGSLEQLSQATSPRLSVQLSDRWIVWIDVRHDSNGLCFWPSGDLDCAFDLYALDRRDRSEHRLTPQSRVQADLLGAFSLDGDHVAYLEREDAGPECYRVEVPQLHRPECSQRLMVLDLRRPSDVRPLPTEGMPLAPSVRGEALAFVELDSENRGTVTATDLWGRARRTLLDQVTSNARLAFAPPWLLYGEGPTLRALHLTEGTLKTLTKDWRPGDALSFDQGRALFSDTQGETLTLYDLSKDTRRIIWEAP